MRVLFWNLGYGRGHTGALGNYLKHGHRFVRHRQRQQQQLLDEVATIVSAIDPQIFSFAEVSTGAFHNDRFDQHEYLLEALGGRHTETLAVCKYGGTAVSKLPFHHGNANGVVSFVDATINQWNFKTSRKKLVLETKLPDLRIMTLHLPLLRKDRRAQLRELATVINSYPEDIVIGGDLNLLHGTRELSPFLAETGLQVAGDTAPTFPAAKPRLPLDVFLYRFKDSAVVPSVHTINTTLSDHLPIVLEW